MPNCQCTCITWYSIVLRRYTVPIFSPVERRVLHIVRVGLFVRCMYMYVVCNCAIDEHGSISVVVGVLTCVFRTATATFDVH